MARILDFRIKLYPHLHAIIPLDQSIDSFNYYIERGWTNRYSFRRKIKQKHTDSN